jgi:hypothetical protein
VVIDIARALPSFSRRKAGLTSRAAMLRPTQTDPMGVQRQLMMLTAVILVTLVLVGFVAGLNGGPV